MIAELRRGQWIKQQENILIHGASGLGKTHLAASLGREGGWLSEKVVELNSFLQTTCWKSFQCERKKGQLNEAMRQLNRCQVLIIDDLGYSTNPMPIHGQFLYQIMEERSKKGLNTIVTMNRQVADLNEALGGDTTVIRAAMDRFFFRCRLLKVAGKSYRLQRFEEQKDGWNDAEEDISAQLKQ